MLPIKIALIFFNVLFLLGGGCFVGLALTFGFNEELDDMYKLIPTSLPRPMLYYVTLSSTILGLIFIALSLISFFALARLNKCLLATYIFGLVVLLIVECTGAVFLAVTPHYLGLEIDGDALIDSWQRNYGLPGREHFTLSADVIQTKYECCGVERGSEYVTSWWSLRELAAPGLVVPLSCCVQGENKSFFDPTPVNRTLCQDKNPEAHRDARHMSGCLGRLKEWLSEQVRWALYIGVNTVLFQLLLLFLAIVASIKL